MSPFISYPGRFDALGFNSKDNYIYGAQLNSNNIVRLKLNNRFDTVGVVTIVDSLKTNAGDCTPDGFYILHEQSLNQLLVFDVVDDFQLVRQIDLFWDPSSSNSGPFETRIFDFAIDPNNPNVAYTHQGTFDHEDLQPSATRGYMLSININFNDPNLGMVTPISSVPVSHFGALLFNPFSNLYGFGSYEQELIPEQEVFYGINPFSGTAIPEINYLGAEFSDGCSCPFSFTFSNVPPPEGFYCSGDKRKFIFTINNNSFNPIENIRLVDTFPEGMVVENVTNPNNINFGTVTGLGTRFLEITNLTIPAKTRLELDVYVRSVDIEVGNWENQAFLVDLPERFDGVLGSDNVFTSGVSGDPSVFFVTPLELLDVEWEAISPTDCLEANDGQIRITSPIFFPGESYDVSVRNKVGWDEFSYQVVADQDSSVLLDALQPGDYQVFQLKSTQDNCSLAIKDTTIILEAPNEQLVLTVDTNAPVCEGETLNLFSSVDPGGQVEWRGPNLFGSEDINPVIENALPENGGEYKVVAEYGFCEQEKFIDADVRPLIDAFLMGDTEYCERDPLVINAEGKGDSLMYHWSGPDNLFFKDSTLIISSITPEQEGTYEVIIDNGACTDTANIDIDVLPTPTLVLPESIKTDFCEPVILMPEITGDKNVSYSWSPGEGLSCDDCLNPELDFIVQSDYKLVIENSFLCKDSSSIQIILDKEKLVHAPNVFVADASSNNDRFKIYPGCVIERIQRFEIFDRSGSKVFSNDLGLVPGEVNAWDGFINNRVGVSGVYVWAIEVLLVDGTVERLIGDITLLRR